MSDSRSRRRLRARTVAALNALAAAKTDGATSRAIAAACSTTVHSAAARLSWLRRLGFVRYNRERWCLADDDLFRGT